MMATNYARLNARGGGPKRYAAPHYANICDVCGGEVPTERFRRTTCDDTCERAKRTKRTRQEQFWRDYAEDKVTV